MSIEDITNPILLDLFCGAGGVAMGYHRAGFEVIGVDINPQPNYPFEFIQSDWREPLNYLPGLWEQDGIQYAIHASPPCQRYSTMTKKWNRQDEHPDLVEPVREALKEIGCHYVIENVEGAPLINAVMLCGSMFGLGIKPKFISRSNGGVSFEKSQYLKKHRLFETTFDLWPPASCAHIGRAVAVYGHSGGSSKRDGIKFGGIDTWKEAMQIDWMTGDELAEAIPPAYTEFIGRHLLAALQSSGAPAARPAGETGGAGEDDPDPVIEG